ncbi:MAG TPA: HypC/HybG/HupF family hydrogenase formation chaperone, partial [Lamprocystis sp. (in: g-proteobacteria)]|nr:HypC/HybG/HupF family hydrogenase formation chaperone [Lamprocystis sp. (in: g-proteobacteria)]
TAIDPSGQTAQIALGAVSKDCSLALIEDAAVGDYVLVHVGYALNRISAEEAQRTLDLMREAGMLDDEQDTPPVAGAPRLPA